MEKLKDKASLVLNEAPRHGGSGGILPRILHVGTKWRWVVSYKLYPGGSISWYPLYQKRVGPSPGVNAVEKRRICYFRQESSLDSSAILPIAKSLYRLNFRCYVYEVHKIKKYILLLSLFVSYNYFLLVCTHPGSVRLYLLAWGRLSSLRRYEFCNQAVNPNAGTTSWNRLLVRISTYASIQPFDDTKHVHSIKHR
jgi:hypothetical protein